MKRAFILVEISEETDEQLRKSVVILRRSIHATQEDVGIQVADLPYYEDVAPVWETNKGERKRLSNKWGFFSDIFDALPGRKQ